MAIEFLLLKFNHYLTNTSISDYRRRKMQITQLCVQQNRRNVLIMVLSYSLVLDLAIILRKSHFCSFCICCISLLYNQNGTSPWLRNSSSILIMLSFYIKESSLRKSLFFSLRNKKKSKAGLFSYIYCDVE